MKPKHDPNAPYFETRFDDLVRAIKALRPAVSTDETRAHLNAILFEVSDEGAIAVATNGHWLAKWEGLDTVAGNSGVVLLPLHAAKQFLALAKDNTDCAIVRVYGNKLVMPPRQLVLMGGGETVIAYAPVTQEFPQWRMVVPPDSIYASSQTPRVVGCSAAYLGAITKAFGAAGARGMLFEFGGETDPIRITAPDEADKLTVILMPATLGAGAELPEDEDVDNENAAE